ncbi:MAG: right-handed parallel beta-helix repeat-containing protein, partial [Ardenticatenaceae bacterium]|nr:right-handed parallel beta-helix repeat-containing protein [Ardenticatenaceae bacterium]
MQVNNRADNRSNHRVTFVGLVCLFTLTLIGALLWLLQAPLTMAQSSGGELDFRVEAATLHVVANGGVNAPPCDTANPCDVYTAVALAVGGDEIHVASGTYVLTGSLVLDVDVLFLGGFDQNNWGSPPNPEINPTILDGNSAFRVIHIQNDASPTIDGFTIRNGLGTLFGAGIFNEGIGSPIISHNKIHDNQTTGASGRGAGVYDDGSATIEFNEIFDNTAVGSARGGGVYIGNASLVTTVVRFNEVYGNSAVNRGGGIFVDGPAFIEGNDVYNNTAAEGGGIDLFLNATAVVQNNLIYQNNAGSLGGGTSFFGGTSQFWNNTVVSNTATTNGAGIYIGANGTASLNNSIVAFNSGGGNSGIHNAGGTVSGDYMNVHTSNNSNVPFATTITADPQFINLATGNLHLTPASPNRNAGNPATPASVNLDFDMEARPNEGTVDIGADEFYPGTPGFDLAGLTPNGEYVDRGSLVTFTYKLENTGTVSDSYDFSCSNDRAWPEISCPATIIDLLPGAIVNVQAVYDVPVGETPLALATTVVTATSQLAPLTDTVAIQSRVRPLAGVGFTPNYSETVQAGEVLTFTHLLTNTGDAADTFTVELVAGSWGQVLPANNYELPLGLGESAEVQIVVTVPPFAAAGVRNDNVIQATSSYDPSVSEQVTTTVIAGPTIGTRYVRTNGSDTDNNCTEPTMPCRTVLHATEQASTNDEIQIASGTYNETTTIPVPNTIYMSGGWSGNFATQVGQDPTIIDMGNQTRAFRIIAGSSNRPVFSNLTIAQGQSVTQGGAVIVESSARPRFELVTFRDSAGTRGGAIYVSTGAEVTLKKTSFLSNTAQIEGGAIYVAQATLLVQQSRFISNTAQSNGGAVFASNGVVSSQNNLFHMNAAANGGAWSVTNGQVTIGNDTLVANTAVNNGAALYNSGGTVSLRNSILANQNSAGEAVFQASGLTQLDFNDYWNNASGDANVATGANSLALDPLFADDVFHLALGSPAIDQGGFSTLEVDFEDDFRPSDQGFDMGWDEVTGCRAKRDNTIYGGIQPAVDANAVSDLILVTGICRGVNNLDVNGTTISQTVRLITDSVTIQGGWNNDFTKRDLEEFPTFVDPEGDGRAFYIGGSINVILDGLVIVNGDATALGGGPADEDAGGAIYVVNSNVTISQSQVLSGTAVLGGAFYNHQGVVTLDSNIFHNNSATDGGAVYNRLGQLNLVNSVLIENQASTNGGAVYNQATNAVFVWHNTIVSNTAGTNGGGVYNINGNSAIRSNIFQGNAATSGPDIFASASTPNVNYNYHYPNADPVVGVAIGANSVSSTTTPPGLVDVGGFDFHVFDNAPVVDAGDPNSPVDHDYEGDLRPSNQASDMGADEVAGCLAQLNGVIYGSLQEAVNNASTGDEIRVSGRCTGVHQYDPSPANGCNDGGVVNTLLHLDANVVLSGGWNENFTNRNQVTTLDALGLGRVIHVAPNITATVDGFDMLNGVADNGAGICIDNAQPTIVNNRIYSHTAVNGAAIYSLNSAARIDGGNQIFGNEATSGGAVFATGATVVTVQNNFVFNNTADDGGAFYSELGNHAFWHNTVVSNTAAANGGAFYSEAGAPVFRSNIVLGNAAAAGGGVFGLAGSSPVLDYNDYFGNSGGHVAGTATIGPNALVDVDPELLADYTVDITSPVVDAGDPNAPLTLDYEEDIRPSHQGFDIGADEEGGCFARIVGDPTDTIYGSVQLAVDDASEGDTIQVDGVCFGVNTNGGVTQNLYLDKSVTLDGDWEYEFEATAVLDAQSEGRIVYIASGTTVTMTDFTLRNGNASLGGGANLGGGVLNDGGTFTLVSANIMGSSANNGGGFGNQGTSLLESVQMFQNSAVNGGGFYMASGVATIHDGRLYLNLASGDGGGLYHNNGQLMLNGNLIYDNGSDDQGGGVYLTGGAGNSVDVRNNMIYKNSAFEAGGLYNNNTSARLWHNTFVTNESGNLYSAGGSPDIRNNIVDGFDGSYDYGLFIAGGSATINYNNVFGNNPDYGGSAAAGPNDISESPLYISRANDDYHLEDDSRGVDEGLSTLGVLDDIDGDIRPTNGDSDMGADEIGSCLVRVIDPVNGPQIFGVLQDAIDFAEGITPLPTVEIARGECKGVKQSAAGTWQVGYIRESLNFVGSLRRLNFSDPDDPHTIPVLAVSTIINAEGNGRVFYVANDASPVFTNLAFVNGEAAGAGGGTNNGGGLINAGGGRPEMYQVWNCANSAENGGAYFGGGGSDVYITGGQIGSCRPAQVTEDEDGDVIGVVRPFFGGNRATTNGGGVYTSGNLEIVNLLVSNNAAFNGRGGGYYNSGVDNTIINGIFYSNTAPIEGGGIYNSGAGLALYHNTIRTNVAGGNGGGVMNTGAGLILNSTVVYSNTAQTGTGGGLNSVGGTLDYNNFYANFPDDSTVGTGPNSISADPDFLATWALWYTSPNVDAADPSLLPVPLNSAGGEVLAWERPSAAPDTAVDAVEMLPGPAPDSVDFSGAVTVGFDARNILRPDGGTEHLGTRLSDIGAYEWYKDFGCAIEPTSQNENVLPGDTITYTFEVSNVGHPYPPTINTVEHGYFDVISITLDSETNPWGTLLGGGLTPELGWYQSVPITLVVEVPTNTVSPVDTAVIRCRSTSMPNRTRTATAQTVVGLTSAILVAPSYNTSALPGNVITFTHYLTNVGLLADEFEIVPNSGVLGLSVAELVDANGTVLISPTVVLDPGETTMALLRVTIVDTAAGGETATPGLTVRSTTEALVQGSVVNQIDIGFIPGTRYVAVGGDDVGNNCTNPTFPCATIQQAVDQALDGDAILVAGGVYNDVVTRTVGITTYTQTVFIDKSVSIQGGYNTLDDFTTVQPITHAVTLDGQDARRVVHVAAGETVVLTSLFIRNGVAAVSTDPLYGGGVYNVGANLTISGTWIMGNEAQYGGGVSQITGTLNLFNTVLAENHNPDGVVGAGGGVYVAGGTAVIENNDFVANAVNQVVPVNADAFGGGLYQGGGTLNLLNNIFASNAGNEGSAAYITQTTVISTNFNLYDGNQLLPPTNFVTGTNSLYGMADFIDGFYHIGPNSAAKDAGTSQVTLAVDFDLQQRPLPAGGLFDIGADERIQRPDFVLLPVTRTALIDPGTAVTYTHWLTNIGDTADSYMLTMTHEVVPPGGGWQYTLSPTTTAVVVPGEFITVTLVVTAGPVGGYVDVTTITAQSVNFISLTERVSDTTTISSTAGVLIEPPQAGSGGPTEVVSYTHTLTNSGNGIDQFFLQVVTATLPGWNVTVVPTQTGYLSPTETATVTVWVTIPAGAGAGITNEVTIAALALDPDAADLVTDTTTVEAGYALSLVPDNSAVVQGPTTVVYTHTLTNLGNISDTVALAVTATAGSPTWTVGLTPTAVTLDPLETQTISVTVAVPDGAAIGVQHVAVVTATSSSPVTLQAAARNTTTIGIEAGVLITPSAQMVITAAGTLVTYEHEIINTGNVSDTFVLTATSTQGWLINFTGETLPPLQPGESVTRTLTISVPVGAAPGQQDDTVLTATSTQDGAISDAATDTTRVEQEHGLLFVPDNTRTVPAPSMVVYTHTLTNTGTGADSYAFTAMSSQSWTVQLPPELPLDAGNSATVMVTLTVPISSEGLVDVMQVTAVSINDPTTVATVTNTTIVSGSQGTPGVVIAPDWTRTAVPGQILLYTHTVTNTGTYTDSYSLNVVSSMTWTVSVAPNNLLNVPPASNRMVTVTVNVPGGAGIGDTDMTTVTVASLTAMTATDTAVDTTSIGQIRDLRFEPNRTMTVSANSLVTYTHYLTNTGNGSDLYVVTAASDRGWITQVPTAPISLNAGEGTTVMVSLVVPLAASGLTDTMTVEVVSVWDFNVSGMVTNTTIVTGALADIDVAIGPDRSGIGLPGEVMTYVHSVINTGSITDDFTLDVSSNQSWSVTVMPGSVTLAPNQAMAVIVTVAIPGTAVNGTVDTTTVTATSFTNNAIFAQAFDETTVGTAPPANPMLYMPFIAKPDVIITPPTPTPTATPVTPTPPTSTPTPTPTPGTPTPTATPCPSTGVDLIVTQIQVVPNPPTAGQPAAIYVTI